MMQTPASGTIATPNNLPEHEEGRVENPTFEQLVEIYRSFENEWSEHLARYSFDAVALHAALLEKLQDSFDASMLCCGSGYEESAGAVVSSLMKILKRIAAPHRSAGAFSYQSQIRIVETLGAFGAAASPALPLLLELLDTRFPYGARIKLEAMAAINVRVDPSPAEARLYRDITTAALEIASSRRASYELKDSAAYVVLVFGSGQRLTVP